MESKDLGKVPCGMPGYSFLLTRYFQKCVCLCVFLDIYVAVNGAFFDTPHISEDFSQEQ